MSILAISATAQYADEARDIISELASRKYAGRGYLDDGHLKASNFISKEMKSSGYEVSFQPFTFPVVTFPGKVSLSVNDTAYEPGTDFTVGPGSPSVKGTFPVIAISRSGFLNPTTRSQLFASAKRKVILITIGSRSDTTKTVVDSLYRVLSSVKNAKNSDVAAIVVHNPYEKKWGIAQSVQTIPTFTITRWFKPSAIKSIELDVESRLEPNVESRNVIGIIKGSRFPDSMIVLTAHYDHLGLMGRTYFPGANDNASGVAMMLTLAKHFAKVNPKYSVVCIAFSGEEVNILGSKYFVDHPTFPLEGIKFLINFDLAGTGTGGLMVVNGSHLKMRFDQLKQLNDSLQLMPLVKPRVAGCISDQCHFYKAGVPCFYIYTMGGPKNYHDVYDVPQALTLSKFDNYTKLMIAYIQRLMIQE